MRYPEFLVFGGSEFRCGADASENIPPVSLRCREMAGRGAV